MHNLRNNTHIQEALQSHKTKTQLVAVGGCGQGYYYPIIIAHFSKIVNFIPLLCPVTPRATLTSIAPCVH